jgi:hypothetical protein
MNKAFFAFLILFLLVFVLGCINVGGGGGQVGPATSSAKITKGILNATVLINGVETISVPLTSQQIAEIGVKLRNIGSDKITNVTGKMYGCLNDTTDGANAKSAELRPNEETYLSWRLQAPTMGQSERLTCPVIMRICFDYITDGYTDIVTLPEDYSGVPPIANIYVTKDLLDMTFDIGTLRIINRADANIVTGNLIISNIGPGWVDYVNYPANSGLEMNKIRSINLTLASKDNGLFINEINEVKKSTLENAGWLTSNGKTIMISSATTRVGNTSYDYLLEMIGGKELRWRMTFDVKDPSVYQNETSLETLNVVVDHGYCIDIASIDAVLSGR